MSGGPAKRAGRGPVDPRLLRHARGSRAGIALLAVLGAGQAGATLLVAVALSRIVAGTGQQPIALLAAAFGARAVLAWAEQVVAARTAARVTDELRRSALAAVLRHGPAWVSRYGRGRLSAVLTNGLDALPPWFSGYLPALVLGVALPPLVVMAMAVVDPASALVAFLTLPLIPVLGALIGWATQARARQRWDADARLAGHFLDVVQGLPTLRLYGRAERQTAVVAEMTDRHRGATMRVLRVAFLSSTALDLIGTLSVGLIAVETGLRVANGSLALGPALLVILLAPEAYRPLRDMAARYHAGAAATAVISDVDEILTAPAPAVGPAPAATGGEKVGVGAVGLRVRYPGSGVDALALDGLVVRGGELVALRGPSGAGKTTALRVLAGLHAAGGGTVAVSGPRPLYLPQRPALPHARTVGDLFAAGPATGDHGTELVATAGGAAPGPGGVRPGAAAARASEVREALRAVGLDGELAPDAPLGEHGGGVSAGQRQRLALAAVLHQARRAPVTLLLDEPTAHLDADAEQLVIARLRAAADAGCAVLAVAHRPALLAAADRIIDVAPPACAPGHRAPPGAPHQATPPGTARGHDPRPSPGGAAGQRPRTTGQDRRASAARQYVAAAGLGAASWLAGVVLTGAAAWLLVRAASLPPVLTLSTAVVLVRASAVARPLLRYLERLAGHNVAFARLGERRARVYADLIPRLPGPRLRRRGDLLTRVVDDVDAQVDGVLRGWLPAASAALALGVAGVAAVLLLPAVGVPLAAGLAVAAVLAPALAARQAARRDAATGRARAELRDAIVETVDGIEELAARDGPAALAVPDRRSRVVARLEARAARAAGLAAGLGRLGWGIAVAGTALGLAGTGALSAEWSAVLLLAVVALGEPVAVLPDAAVARQRAAGARRRLAELTSSPVAGPPSGETGRSEPGRSGTGRVAGTFSGAVRVRGLVAGWDPAAEPALRELDLELPAGARVAILGPSGGGKSTLAAVLTRLLAPRAGTVELGHGEPGRAEWGWAGLGELSDAVVREVVGLVSDDADHVFASSVRENLRLAKPGATDAELDAALARVGLGRWRAQLPDGLGTWLGAGGTTMSGGQRRRFATARALLADPVLLILDEPTEGLDEDGAGALMADLLAAAAGRTVLLLTHRTDGLGLVDVSYRLSGGALVRRQASSAEPRPGLRAGRGPG